MGVGSKPRGLEVVALDAAADVELITDHRKPHRMRAVQQLAVRDGVMADVMGNRVGAAAVPAGTMSGFWIHSRSYQLSAISFQLKLSARAFGKELSASRVQVS